MSKRTKSKGAAGGYSEVGIDVSKDWLDVSHQRGESAVRKGRFDNAPKAHRALIGWLRKISRGSGVRIVVESTGIYSFDVALALQQAGMEVMVVNPRAAHSFSNAQMQRTRTDLTAADCLRQFAARMEFTPWKPPALEVRELRAMARRLATLSEERAAERNRLHALRSSREQSKAVRRDVEHHIRHLTRRIAALLEQAKAQIEAHASLRRPYEQLISVKGIGSSSAVRLLGELLMLPADMTAKQWVAHCGLDPRVENSGSSVRTRPRISKQGNAHLRAGLYMPALVAKHWQPNVRAFSEKLAARGKAPLQVTVAVMRKLLHAIHGMFATDTKFEAEKFYRIAAQEAA